MAISKDRFRKALDTFYTKEILFKLYEKYFLDWIAEGYVGSHLGLFEISLISKTTNKQTFLELLEQAFTKEEIFKTIYEKFSKNLQEVFYEIAWNNKFCIKDMGIYFKGEKTYDYTSDLKEEYLFFKVGGDIKKGLYLYLENDIVRVIRQALDKPMEYNINNTKVPKEMLCRNCEEDILLNLKKYYNFYKQGGVNLSSSGKILKESKNMMRKYCNISEFYENAKDLDYLKTESIALFFFLIKDKYLNNEFFKVSNLKEIVTLFLNGELLQDNNSTYITLYLNYLKGVKNISKSRDEVKRGIRTISKIMEEFSDNGVVSLENIIKAVLFRDEFIEVIDIESAYDIIYINEANYERTKITNYDKYISYVVVPFIKSVFFILGILGVVELYYEHPSINNSLYLKNGYLSKYDGLKYVKLTELGKYILGRTESYNFKTEDDGEIVLDDDRTIVTLMGDFPVKVMFLERVGNKIAPNKFRITSESFLRGVTDTAELKSRITEFEEKIAKDYSSVWKEFFGGLLGKMSSINHMPEYHVFQLKKNKELLNCIGKDDRFKSLILKGEEFHIIVKKENLDKVIELFREHGYYVNF
jgi:hypothetical protein